jgi:hypothetical protein
MQFGIGSDHETAIRRGLVSSRLFSVTVRMPSFSLARTDWASTVAGNVKLRWNLE